MAHRVVDALEIIEVEEETRDLRSIAQRLREDLAQSLVQQRSIRKPGENVVLSELVGMRCRDLELLRPLRDFFLERALIVHHFALRLGEPLRHVVERVREQSELVRRFGGHVNVESPRAHGARRAHEAPHRRDEAARQQ